MLTEEQKAQYSSIIALVINARKEVESPQFKAECTPGMYEVALRAQEAMEIAAKPFMEALEKDAAA